MLIEKAIAFENSSYRGLFHFIRYIEKLQKYDVDFGEAEIVSENDEAVRIMSIHKSKGLEFPICFVAGLGKRFNMSDSYGKIVVHPQFGIGVEEYDTKRQDQVAVLCEADFSRADPFGKLRRGASCSLCGTDESKRKTDFSRNPKKTGRKIRKLSKQCRYRDAFPMDAGVMREAILTGFCRQSIPMVKDIRCMWIVIAKSRVNSQRNFKRAGRKNSF